MPYQRIRTETDPGGPVVRMLHIDYDAEDWTLQVADDLYAADRHEFAFEWTELSSANASCQVCWLIGHNEPIMAILCTSFRKVPIPSGIGVSPRSEEARVPA